MPGSRRKHPLDCLPELMQAVDGQPQVLSKMLANELFPAEINQVGVTCVTRLVKSRAQYCKDLVLNSQSVLRIDVTSYALAR